MSPETVRPTGHLQVKGSGSRRSYYALWRDAEGRHQKRLGPAWIRDSGRRTPRGATIWRTANGPKPDPSFLTPAEAEDELRQLLAEAPRVKRVVSPVVTFGQACDDWLHYIEFDRRRARSTLGDYRRSIRRYLLPAFGPESPVSEVTTRMIDDVRDELLGSHLSPRTVQKVMVINHGILKRAKRKGWIATNPAEDAERTVVQRSGDFTVLTPVEVAATARAASDPMLAALYTTAAFSGLRMGELRALRWGDVDFDKRLIHVRRSFSLGEFDVPKSRKVRSVPMVDQVLTVLEQLSWRERFVSAEDIIFCTPIGRPLYDQVVRNGFYAALDKAGLGRLREKDPPIVFHDLRHTFGTLAVRVFPLTDVKAYMGHQNIETTMIYVHHVPQHDAAAKLSAVLRSDTELDAREFAQALSS